MAQWQFGARPDARELLGKANAWIARNRSTDSDLQRFHIEAIELINDATSIDSQ